MPVEVKIKTANAVSVDDEPGFIRFWVPSVFPGEYFIPGLNTPSDEIAERCTMSIRGYDGKLETYQYASVKEIDGHRYVLLKIAEARTKRESAAEQQFDEYGNRLVPPIMRALEPVAPEAIANEIERSYGYRGVLAIAGDEPTSQELREAERRNLEWKRKSVETVARMPEQIRQRQVTEQVRRHALELYKKGYLGAVPIWADAAIGLKQEDVFNCAVCQTVLRKDAVICTTCHAVYNWRQAVNLGIKAPHEVPPDKRIEAGLIEPNLPDERAVAPQAS